MSQDGSRPAEGAIKGGSILPGERGGQPEAAPEASRDERLQRCRELSGSLREECLRRERSAAGGASTPPALPDKPRRGPSNWGDPGT